MEEAGIAEAAVLEAGGERAALEADGAEVLEAGDEAGEEAGEEAGKEEEAAVEGVGQSAGKKKPFRRAPKDCPICQKKVINLPRHMRTAKHNWVGFKARAVVSTNNLRKACEPKGKHEAKKTKKDYHKRRQCPVPRCFSVVKRLDAHLRRAHNLDKKSEVYRKFLSSAKVYVQDEAERERKPR